MSFSLLRRLPWRALLLFALLLIANATRAQQPLYVLALLPLADSSAQAGAVVPTEATPTVALHWAPTEAGAQPLPVDLTELTISRPAFDAPGVLLYWTTTAERRNAGFEIERRVEGDTTFHRVARVPGQGTSYDTHHYAFVDEGNRTPKPTYYRLRQLDADGGPSTYSPEQQVPGLPAGYPRPEPED